MGCSASGLRGRRAAGRACRSSGCSWLQNAEDSAVAAVSCPLAAMWLRRRRSGQRERKQESPQTDCRGAAAGGAGAGGGRRMAADSARERESAPRERGQRSRSLREGPRQQAVARLQQRCVLPLRGDKEGDLHEPDLLRQGEMDAKLLEKLS